MSEKIIICAINREGIQKVLELIKIGRAHV